MGGFLLKDSHTPDLAEGVGLEPTIGQMSRCQGQSLVPSQLGDPSIWRGHKVIDADPTSYPYKYLISIPRAKSTNIEFLCFITSVHEDLQ